VNVSPDFSPPMRIMAPYFMVASLSYVMAMVLLFFLDIGASWHQAQLLGWVHLYMIGFVMMSIIAAMAQLGPVIVEANHRFLSFFHLIWVFLVVGLIVILSGFYLSASFLPFGGMLVLTGMLLFVVDFWWTLQHGGRHTSVTRSMKASNVFLLFGVLSGLVMAFIYNGAPVALAPWFNSHVFALLGGFVMMLIMGIATILVPMFGSSKRVSDNDFGMSFISMLTGVILAVAGALFVHEGLQKMGMIWVMFSVAFFGYRLFQMLTSRARVEHDIWARSMYVAAVSLALSWLFVALHFFGISELLRPGLWLLLVGFTGFMILGNFYKILPFLVWFQRYAPLVEEQAVPMLHELVNRRLASAQFFFSSSGLFLSTLALLVANPLLFDMGVSLLVVGGVLMFVQVIHMIRS